MLFFKLFSLILWFEFAFSTLKSSECDILHTHVHTLLTYRHKQYVKACSTILPADVLNLTMECALINLF